MVVRSTIGKNPLEVGADRIARTAVAALGVIDELGSLYGRKIELAWTERLCAGIHAIEVYPAGTLRSHEGGRPVSADVTFRKNTLLKKLMEDGKLALDTEAITAMDNEHVLDSVLCAVAAMDFFEGMCIYPKPDEEALARKEGWIWVATP